MPQSPVSPPVVKPAVSSAAAKPVQNSGNVGKQTTSDDTEETAESECGPVHGKCPNDLCCSLHNECGKPTAIFYTLIAFFIKCIKLKLSFINSNRQIYGPLQRLSRLQEKVGCLPLKHLFRLVPF